MASAAPKAGSRPSVRTAAARGHTRGGGAVCRAATRRVTARSVIRQAGAEALTRHWPGTDDGLAVVGRLAGLPAAAPQE